MTGSPTAAGRNERLQQRASDGAEIRWSFDFSCYREV
jgi:hypothetical protein